QSRIEGNWYPRWAGNSFSGFGMPIFYFYPPLAYLTASFFDALFGGSANQLFHITIVFYSLLSIVTAYIYLESKHIERRTAIIASILYSALPYRFVDIVSRSSISEHLLFAWVPLVFLALDSLLEGKHRSGFV